MAGLGLLLCVLAALFAIEAKLAWYGPAASPATQISASKLQPSEAPRVVAQALASSRPVAHFPAIGQILSLAIAVSAARISPRVADAPRTGVPRFGFSPQTFFRPPPSL